MSNHIKVGDLTDRGIVEKIVYLVFSKNGSATGSYSSKPLMGRSGIVCAQIGNKAIPVYELKKK